MEMVGSGTWKHVDINGSQMFQTFLPDPFCHWIPANHLTGNGACFCLGTRWFCTRGWGRAVAQDSKDTQDTQDTDEVADCIEDARPVSQLPKILKNPWNKTWILMLWLWSLRPVRFGMGSPERIWAQHSDLRWFEGLKWGLNLLLMFTVYMFSNLQQGSENAVS